MLTQETARELIEHAAQNNIRREHEFSEPIEPRKTKTGVWYAPCLRCRRELQILPGHAITGSAIESRCE